MKDQWIIEYKKPLTVDRFLLLNWGQQTSYVLTMFVLTGILLVASFCTVLCCPVLGDSLL